MTENTYKEELRDHLAEEIMVRLIDKMGEKILLDNKYIKGIAVVSYTMADAMMCARIKDYSENL